MSKTPIFTPSTTPFTGKETPMTSTIARQTPVAHVMTITPQVAEQWLANSTGNRKISENKVRQYARIMEQGGWMLNGEAIIFDDQNQLRNGQHRLTAIIKSDTPIQSMVVWGVTPESFVTMDTGMARTAGQVLTMAGYKNTNVLSGTVVNIIQYETFARMGIRGYKSIPTHAEIIATLEERPGIYDSVERCDGGMPRIKGAGSSTFAAIHYLIGNDQEPMREEFFEAVGTGELLQRGDPAHTLRNRLYVNAQRPALTRTEVAAMIIKSWNAHKAGKQVHILKYLDVEDFPTIK